MEDTIAKANLSLDPVQGSHHETGEATAFLLHDDDPPYEGRIRGFVWKDGTRYRGMLHARPGSYHADDLNTLREIMERDLSKPSVSLGEVFRRTDEHGREAFDQRPRNGHVYAEQIGYNVYHDGIKGRIGSIKIEGKFFRGKLAALDGDFESPSLQDVLAAMGESEARGKFFETGYKRAMESYTATTSGQLAGWEAGAKVVLETAGGIGDD